MGGAGDEIGPGHRAWVLVARDQAGDVGHIDHEHSPVPFADLGDLVKRDDPRVGAGAGDHQLGFVLAAEGFHLVEIEAFIVLADAVVVDLVQLAREVQVHAVGEVATVRQTHGDDGVARLQGGEIDRHVGAGACMGLHVGRLGAEELAGPLDGQKFDLIDRFATTVVALAGVAFGVFVGEDTALCRQDGRRGVVLAGDHLEAGLLAFALGQDRFPNRRVTRFDRVHAFAFHLVENYWLKPAAPGCSGAQNLIQTHSRMIQHATPALALRAGNVVREVIDQHHAPGRQTGEFLAMAENLSLRFAMSHGMGEHHMVEMAQAGGELPQKPIAVQRGGIAEQKQGALALQTTKPAFHSRVDLENIGKSPVKLLVGFADVELRFDFMAKISRFDLAPFIGVVEGAAETKILNSQGIDGCFGELRQVFGGLGVAEKGNHIAKIEDCRAGFRHGLSPFWNECSF